MRQRALGRSIEETSGCVPPRGTAPRQQIGQEDGERALARSIGTYQAPRPVAGRVSEPVGDLREGAANRRRDEIPVESIRRSRIAVEVHRAPKAALDLDAVHETRRFLAGVHRPRFSTDRES